MKTSLKLLVPLTLLFYYSPLHAQVAFAPAVKYSVGIVGLPARPWCVTAADIKGDGKLALICADYGWGNSNEVYTLTVLTNNGNGRFGFNANYVVGTMPDSVVAADVNGDGKVDLICANYADSTLTVLTNNGSGRFGSNATYAAGSHPVQVIAADVNGDGAVDLICANSIVSPGTLRVLTNNGSGGFVLSATLTVGQGTASVAAADVNGDGKVDLICANYEGYDLTVLTNDGYGGFVVASWVGTTESPSSIVAADVNGDGKVDLIVGRAINGALVLTNDGHGAFVSSCNEFLMGSSVTVADVNSDGKPDWIGMNGGSTLTVMTNNRSGGFATAASLVAGSGGNSPSPQVVAAADLNGDGHVDLICVNASDHKLSVFISLPTLTITSSSNNVRVSWPSSWKNWTLEQNSDLTTTTWSASGGISDDGTNKSLTIQPAPRNLFFRMSHP